MAQETPGPALWEKGQLCSGHWMETWGTPALAQLSKSTKRKDRVRQRAVLGIEPRTSRTLSENHTTRPNSLAAPRRPCRRKCKGVREPRWAASEQLPPPARADNIAWVPLCRERRGWQAQRAQLRRGRGKKRTDELQDAVTQDRTGDLQIFSLTLSQLSYRGLAGSTIHYCCQCARCGQGASWQRDAIFSCNHTSAISC